MHSNLVLRLFEGKMYWNKVPIKKNLFCLETITENTKDNANINIWTYSKERKKSKTKEHVLDLIINTTTTTSTTTTI